MAPQSPRKKRIHLPGAARRFVPPSAVATAAAVAPTFTPAAQEVQPIEPSTKVTVTGAALKEMPAAPAAAASSPVMTEAAAPPQPSIHASAVPEVHPRALSAAAAATPMTTPTRLGITRRSRARTTRRRTAKETPFASVGGSTTAADSTSTTSRSDGNDRSVAADTKEEAETAAVVAETPPSPSYTKVVSADAVAVKAPVATSMLPGSSVSTASAPSSAWSPSSSSPRRATISRVPKKKKLFAKSEENSRAVAEGIPDMATTAAPSSQPTATPAVVMVQAAVEADAAAVPAIAPPRRATISRIPKKRAKASIEVGAETAAPASAPDVADTTAAPTPAAAAATDATFCDAIARQTVKKRFFAEMSDEATAATTATQAPAASAVASQPVVPPTSAQASAAEVAEGAPVAETPVQAAPQTRQRPVVSRTHRRGKGTGAAAPTTASPAALVAEVPEKTAAAVPPADNATEDVKASKPAAEAPVTTTPAARKSGAKPKKQPKRLSPAALRRRELAALNRIPRRFRPLTPPWHGRETVEAAATVVGKQRTVVAAPAPAEATAAGVQPPSTTEDTALPTTSESPQRVDASRTTTEAVPTVAAEAKAALEAVELIPTPASAAAGATDAVTLAPAPASSTHARRDADSADEPHSAETLLQGKRRFFGALEEVPAEAEFVLPSTVPSATVQPPLKAEKMAAATEEAACRPLTSAAENAAAVSSAMESSKEAHISPAVDAAPQSASAEESPVAQPAVRRPTSVRALLRSTRMAHKQLKRMQRRNRRQKARSARAAAAEEAAPDAMSSATVSAPSVRAAVEGAEPLTPLKVENKQSAALVGTEEAVTAPAEAEATSAPSTSDAAKSTASSLAQEEPTAPAEATTAAPPLPPPPPLSLPSPLKETPAASAEEPVPVHTTHAANAAEAFPSSTARRLAAKKRIKKHAKLAAARLKKQVNSQISAAAPSPAAVDIPLVQAVHASAEPLTTVADAPSAEALLRDAALTLPSGHVVIESFTETEMVLRRGSLDDSWDVGLRFDWQERTLTISAFPEFDRDDVRATHPFVQLYKSRPRWLLKEVNEASATHMKEALNAMKRSLTARFVFRRLPK